MTTSCSSSLPATTPPASRSVRSLSHTRTAPHCAALHRVRSRSPPPSRARARTQTPAWGNADLRNVREGDIIQLERRGFFRCDAVHKSDAHPVRLVMIPDGKSKAMSNLASRLAHR